LVKKIILVGDADYVKEMIFSLSFRFIERKKRIGRVSECCSGGGLETLERWLVSGCQFSNEAIKWFVSGFRFG